MDCIYIINWKLYFTYATTIAFVRDNQAQLSSLAHKPGVVLGVAPLLVALSEVKCMFEQAGIVSVAAQVSQYEQGSYTGEIDALSLYQLGCRFGIVGHAERRMIFGDTNTLVTQQFLNLIGVGIIPIVCVGEAQKEQLETVLFEQLSSLKDVLRTMPCNHLVIGYEPVWAIGSNETSINDAHLKHAVYLIRMFFAEYHDIKLSILYGGNVTMKTIAPLRSLNLFDGFLIGRAGCDMQQLENIVQ